MKQNLTDHPSPPASCLNKSYSPHSSIHTSTNINGYIKLNTNELFFYFFFPHILKIVNKFVKQEKKHPFIHKKQNESFHFILSFIPLHLHFIIIRSERIFPISISSVTRRISSWKDMVRIHIFHWILKVSKDRAREFKSSVGFCSVHW